MTDINDVRHTSNYAQAEEQIRKDERERVLAQETSESGELLLRCNACGTLNSFGPEFQSPAAMEEKLSFGQALDLAAEGLSRWKNKEHNAKWWRRIDGTPIPNDLLVNIATVFAERSLSITSTVLQK